MPQETPLLSAASICTLATCASRSFLASFACRHSVHQRLHMCEDTHPAQDIDAWRGKLSVSHDRTLNKQEGAARAHLECFHLLRLLLGEALLGHELCGAAQDVHARAAPKLEHVPNAAQNTTASSAPSVSFSIVCPETELEHAKGQVPWLA